MSKYIKKFNAGTPEFTALETAAKIMTKMSPKGYEYYVGDTYFDYGQDWMWTTILCNGGNYGGYQALSPRAQEEIITATAPEALEAAVRRVFSGKWCPDRVDRKRVEERNLSDLRALTKMYN